MLESKPCLDPRDALPASILRHDVLKMEDLQPGMLLQGTVRGAGGLRLRRYRRQVRRPGAYLRACRPLRARVERGYAARKGAVEHEGERQVEPARRFSVGANSCGRLRRIADSTRGSSAHGGRPQEFAPTDVARCLKDCDDNELPELTTVMQV